MFKSLTKIFITLFLVVSSMAVLRISGTNAFFTDSAEISGATFSSGYWIPVLTMTVDPESPNGDNGFYTTKPCVTLTASITDLANTEIFYRLTDGGVYTKYSGICVEIPDGKWDFDAYAIFDNNSDWKSNSVFESFKVDTVAPSVKINEPDNDDEVSEIINIKATVQDENSHHYWLVIENEDGTVVAGPGTVNETDSFEKRNVFTWDTTKVPDGEYTIKLEARDEAGNKDPDQAPVTDDPEVPGDSVDWITVEVKNVEPEVEPGDVIINEVMWMGSDGKSLDQWVELKNVSSEDVHIRDWYLTYKSNAGNELELLEIKDNRIIKKGEYLLISYYTKNNSAIDVQPDDDSMNDFGYQKFQIKLYTDKNKTILVDTAGSGDREPTEGDKEKFYSMERSSNPGDGSDYSNWYTCEDGDSNIYWDDGRLERGTPGHENMSDNDPAYLEKSENDSKEETPADSVQNDGEALLKDDDSNVGSTEVINPDSDDLLVDPSLEDPPKVIEEVVVSDPKPIETVKEPEVVKDPEPEPKPAELIKEPEKVKTPEPPEEEPKEEPKKESKEEEPKSESESEPEPEPSESI